MVIYENLNVLTHIYTHAHILFQKYRLPIEVSFTTSQPREFNFNLECRVKRKPTPLHLNVKASGYTIRMGLLYTSPGGDDVELPVQPQTSTVINFGKVKKCSMLLDYSRSGSSPVLVTSNLLLNAVGDIHVPTSQAFHRTVTQRE